MKTKISLRLQIFGLVLLFGAIIILVVSLFQTTMLEAFYKNTKIRSVKNICESAVNLDNNELRDLAIKQEVSIYLLDESSKESLVFGDQSPYFERIMSSLERISELSSSNNQVFFICFDVQDPLPFEGPLINDSIIESSIDKDIICARRLAGPSSKLLIVDSRLETMDAAKMAYEQELIYIILIILGLSIIASIIISKIISSPIKKMTIDANNLASGNLDVKFIGTGYKEIKELNDALNYAVEEINKSTILEKEILANISHDLKTPLTLISGYAEMMKDMKEEVTDEHLDVIINETKRLNGLVNDLVDLSKIQSRTIKFNNQVFDLDELINNIVTRQNILLKDNGYIINYQGQKDIKILADEGKIEQIVYNFITNAVSYSLDNKKIDINLEVFGDFVKVGVRDYGIGISEEDVPHVWKRYYQVDKTHQRDTKSSGLGLAIVQAICEAYGFKYGVDSTLGDGSTFYFICPIKKD